MTSYASLMQNAILIRSIFVEVFLKPRSSHTTHKFIGSVMLLVVRNRLFSLHSSLA